MRERTGWLRGYVLALGVALLWGSGLAVLIEQPGYTDAYYYYNAAERLVTGNGLTDAGLWNYINAPESLPAPSHTYWMPLQSLVAAASMWVFGAHFGAAQVPSVLCFAALVVFTFWLARRCEFSERQVWLATLLVLFGGFFTIFWTTTDTFALYGVVGAGALAASGLGRKRDDWRWFALAGGLSALGHLTRADGVLLLGIAILAALWPGATRTNLMRGRAAAAAIGVYVLVLTPWFVRNINVIGTPLPVGGTQTIWLRGYDEIVNYPAGVSPADFWDWGLSNIFRSRIRALGNNLGTFIAVETWVVLGPFVLAAWWQRRRDPFWFAFTWYALGLHLAMTFVFAYPGYRGGLFHSSAALLPYWAVLGVSGLDQAIDWAARRRQWPPAQARLVFGGALVVVAAAISVGILAARLDTWNDNGSFYREVAEQVPTDAVLMVNSPATLYYHTGLSGVVIPNADPAVVPEIAARYGVTYLLLDVNRTEPFTALLLGEADRPFLRLVKWYDGGTAKPDDDRRLFEIVTVLNGAVPDDTTEEFARP